MDGRTILHVDMDAFFTSVEQRDRPELRGKPVVVGAPHDQRGVVAAASYEARTFGIHSAMPSREAYRRCPDAVFLPVNGQRYHDVSKQIFAIFERFTPLVEGLSIDEAFLDVTGSKRIFGDGPAMARELKRVIREETGLAASVGVAPNKFLAKLASDLEKPDGLTVVPRSRQGIMEFLAPLPVGRLWGVGEVSRKHLEEIGILLIGDLQSVDAAKLSDAMGKHSARHLQRLACGEDEREVETEHEAKSMSREHTFAHDCRSAETLHEVLAGLVEDVGGRLRAAERFARVAHLKLRWQGFKTITRQRPLERPSCDDFTLREIAADMLNAEPLVKAVRLIGFGVSHMSEEEDAQMSLFDEKEPEVSKREELSRTVDSIREKHGKESIGSGTTRSREQ